MAAFGLGSTGTNARNQLDQMPAWFWDLFKQYAGQAKDEDAFSQNLRNQFLADLTQRQQEGIGGIDLLQSLGRGIMPGVDDAIARIRDRNAGARGVWSGMPRAGDTAGEISGAIDQYGQGINSTGDTISRDIGDTFNRVRGRTDAYGRSIVNNIGDVYGGLVDSTGRTYAGLGSDVAGTFAGLGGATDTAFNDIEKTLEQLRPGGEARAARVGRSFDPARADTAMRLRKFGIDPNSPEGNAALQRVEVARSAAMDDSLAGDTRDYVAQSNAAKLGRLDRNTSLGLGRLDRSTSLGRESAGIDRDLRLAQGSEFRDEQRRQDDLGRGLDLSQLQANTANNNLTQDRSRDYWQQRAQLPTLLRSMGIEDLNIERLLNSDENSADMNALNLALQQFQQGMGYRNADLGYRNQAGNQIGAVGAEAFDRSGEYSNRGNQYANAAGQGWNNTYQREAANSNWLGKTLLGLGGAALGAFTGGMTGGLSGLGAQAGGWLGGLFGGGSGRAGGSGGGAFSLFPGGGNSGGIAGNLGGGSGGIAGNLGGGIGGIAGAIGRNGGTAGGGYQPSGFWRPRGGTLQPGMVY